MSNENLENELKNTKETSEESSESTKEQETVVKSEGESSTSSNLIEEEIAKLRAENEELKKEKYKKELYETLKKEKELNDELKTKTKEVEPFDEDTAFESFCRKWDEKASKHIPEYKENPFQKTFFPAGSQIFGVDGWVALNHSESGMKAKDIWKNFKGKGYKWEVNW